MSPQSPPERPESSGTIDRLDRAIIGELQRDGRASYRAIARALQVPEATVRFRVNRLPRTGRVSVTVFVPPDRSRRLLAGLTSLPGGLRRISRGALRRARGHESWPARRPADGASVSLG